MSLPRSGGVVGVDEPFDLAILCGVLRPYRVHFHRRIVRELPNVRLHTGVLFEKTLVPVPDDLFDPAINPRQFGPGESVADQGRPAKAWRAWRKGGEVIRWLERSGVRAVVVVGYGDPAFLRVIRWCRARAIPCWLWADSNIHGDSGVRGFKGLLKRRFVRGVTRRCAGVMVCGEFGRRYFERYGVPGDRIRYVPYEPDYGVIESVTEAEIVDAGRRYGLTEGRRHLLFAGRLHPRKRVDLALAAFLASAERRPDWDFVMMGKGPMEAELLGMIPAELAHRVKRIPFLEDQRTVAAIFRGCDAFTLPSDYEAWALVINEAAAAGLALIASDIVGAARHLVIDDVNGRTFPKGDLAALTEATLAVTDPARIDRLKAGSRSVLARWRAEADPVAGLATALGLQRPD